MRRTRLERALPAVWALLLALLVLGPGLGPGLLLVRDMVWVPDLTLRADVLGLGSGLPRAVPSDAVVAVLDEVVPGAWLQKLVLVGALAGGGVGATRLLPRGAGPVALVTVVSLYVWNALVLERLLMGAWPVLVGYAVLPWLIDAARRWRTSGRLPVALLVLAPLGSLSASAGLATAVAVLAGAAGRGRTPRALALLAAANAPWLVAGLLHAGSATSDAAGAEVFALRGEGSVPAPVAALTLGGIWNTDVQPGSRTGLLGWLALVVLLGLAAAGARTWWRRTDPRQRTVLLGCWAVGWGAAVVTWLAPGVVGWLAAHVPGAGVARDGARSLVLCAPLLAVLVAEGARVLVAAVTAPAARVALGVAAALVPVVLLPDLAYGVGQRLRPVDLPTSYADARNVLTGLPGDVLVLPLSSYRAPAWNHGTPVLDPLGRAFTPDTVTSDVLVVDGVPLSGEDPRVRDAAEALGEASAEARAAALTRLGFAAVVTDPRAPSGTDQPEVAGEVLLAAPDLVVTLLPDPGRRAVPAGWAVAVGAAWVCWLALPLLAGALLLLRTRTRRRGVVTGE